MSRDDESTGIVLAGAAALGAYEVGALSALVEDLAPALGRARIADVVSGSSAGAINAAAYAATIDDPVAGMARLRRVWSGLRLADILQPSAVELLWMLVETGLGPPFARRWMSLCGPRGALFDAQPIRRLLEHTLPIDRVGEHVRAGRIAGVAIGATHVATGRAAVFYASARPVPPWPASSRVRAVATRLGLDHVMASLAIPLVFAPVEIDGDLYCDGGLRQVVPLSPALHLGATRLVVIDPLPGELPPDPVAENLRREAARSPLYLGGKALDALFADRLEIDLARLEQVTAIVRAGERRFGPGFTSALNAELAHAGAPPVRAVPTLRIAPSIDLGARAVDYVMRPAFERGVRGPAARVLRRLAEAGQTRAGDLLSFLLFDGGFAAELIELGRADTLTRRDALLAALAEAPAPAVAARAVQHLAAEP
jgi:NTE family protein